MINDPLFILVVALVFFMVLLSSQLIYKVYKLNKRIDELLGNSRNMNLEGAIHDFYHEIKEAKQLFKRNDDFVHTIIDASDHFFCKMGLVHYNAFEDTGGETSYVLCLLNKEKDGVLMNSLHSRNGTRVYAKEIKKGHYKGNLSTEELEALNKALQSNSI